MRDDSFKDYVLDQLTVLGAVRARAMFGGHGLYRGPEFFGILGGCSRHRPTSSIHGVVHQGRLYFRTDARTRPDYIARGMSPFQPNPRQTLVSYYEVPAEVLDDTEILAGWARAALSAHAGKRGK
jgi:DNA transformation protein